MEGKGFFPQVLGSGGARYVFFTSLLHPDESYSNATKAVIRRTGHTGRNYITQSGTKMESDDEIDLSIIHANMKKVLQNLKAIADAEYAKESAYIKAQKVDTSIFKNPFPKSPEDNWSQFVTLLNFAKGNADSFFSDVEAEYSRIDNNIKYLKKVEEKIKNGKYLKEAEKEVSRANYSNDKDYTSAIEARRKEKEHNARLGYQRSGNKESAAYVTTLIKQLFTTQQFQKEGYGNIIKDYILKQHWNKFLYEANGRLTYDPKTLHTLILFSVQTILQNLRKTGTKNLEHVFGKGKTYQGRMKAFTKWIEQEENKRLSGLDKIESILDKPFAKTWLANEYQQKLQIREKTISQTLKEDPHRQKEARKIAEKAIKQQEGQSTREVGYLRDILADMITDGRWLDINSELLQPSGSWIFSEAKDLTIGILNDERGVSLGSSRSKVDNAFLKIDIGVNESILDQEADKIRKILSKDYYTTADAEKVTNKDISTANWRKRQEEWKRYKEELSLLLKEKGNIQDLSESFIVETSDKMYESYGGHRKAFSGGSLGPNLISQLSKIDDLAWAGGMSLGDLDWLRSAVINTHNSALGAGMKTSLENYLSMVATAILFDDGLEIMQQATQNVTQAVSSTSVNVIHLFHLQGILYYPLSQILYSVYNSLSKAVDETESLAKKGGAQITITYKGYPKNETPYTNLTEQVWEDTGKAAENATLLRLAFLGNLLDVLQSLGAINPNKI